MKFPKLGREALRLRIPVELAMVKPIIVEPTIAFRSWYATFRGGALATRRRTKPSKDDTASISSPRRIARRLNAERA
jgi:hypothetical protein